MSHCFSSENLTVSRMGTASWICRGSVLVSERDISVVSRHWKSFLLDWNVWSCIWVKLQVEGQGWPTPNPCRPLENLLKKTLEQKACRDGENSAETQEKGSASVFSGFSVTVWKTTLDRNLEKKGLIWPAGYLVYHERKPRNNSWREPWGRNCSRDHRRILFTVLLLTACSACFVTAPGTICPGVAPPTVGWGLPH